MPSPALRPWMEVEQVAMPFPERLWPKEGRWDEALRRVGLRLRRRERPRRPADDAVVRRVLRLERRLRRLSPEVLREQAAALRPELLRHGFTDRLLALAFGLTREACGRELGMRHFPVQLLGGREILAGRIAEMATGEGKTITALLPAAAAALAGVPVHVVTVNDYLAERDAANLRPIYRALGLTVALVREGMAPDERRAAYAADITYVTLTPFLSRGSAA